MRSQQRDRLGEFVARASPPEFLVRNVALVTIRKSEIVLTRLGEPIELVLGIPSESQSRLFSVK